MKKFNFQKSAQKGEGVEKNQFKSKRQRKLQFHLFDESENLSSPPLNPTLKTLPHKSSTKLQQSFEFTGPPNKYQPLKPNIIEHQHRDPCFQKNLKRINTMNIPKNGMVENAPKIQDKKQRNGNRLALPSNRNFNIMAKKVLSEPLSQFQGRNEFMMKDGSKKLGFGEVHQRNKITLKSKLTTSKRPVSNVDNVFKLQPSFTPPQHLHFNSDSYYYYDTINHHDLNNASFNNTNYNHTHENNLDNQHNFGYFKNDFNYKNAPGGDFVDEFHGNTHYGKQIQYKNQHFYDGPDPPGYHGNQAFFDKEKNGFNKQKKVYYGGHNESNVATPYEYHVREKGKLDKKLFKHENKMADVKKYGSDAYKKEKNRTNNKKTCDLDWDCIRKILEGKESFSENLSVEIPSDIKKKLAEVLNEPHSSDVSSCSIFEHEKNIKKTEELNKKNVELCKKSTCVGVDDKKRKEEDIDDELEKIRIISKLQLKDLEVQREKEKYTCKKSKLPMNNNNYNSNNKLKNHSAFSPQECNARPQENFENELNVKTIVQLKMAVDQLFENILGGYVEKA